MILFLTKKNHLNPKFKKCTFYTLYDICRSKRAYIFHISRKTKQLGINWIISI